MEELTLKDLMDKLNKIESEIKDMKSDNNTFKRWSEFYLLSLGADILTGQKKAPSSFL